MIYPTPHETHVGYEVVETVTHHPVSLCVKLATEPFELEQIYALNHKTFVEEIPRYAAAPNGLLVDRFDTENTYVIGPLIGTPGARFQPMMLTLERFALRARALFRNLET